MSPSIHWCPFCGVKLYKSKGNLNNHIEQHHEPQKHYHCNECNGSWTTALGYSRHTKKVGCSGCHLETRHHESKKSLYACGVCARAFDDFGLRQDHLFTHQQSGVGKASWDMNNVMLGLLSHSSIVGPWNAAVQRKSNNYPSPQWQPRWDWSNPQAGEALAALEHMRFDNRGDLDRILDNVMSALTSASEQQLHGTGYDALLNIDTEMDFGALSEEDFVNYLRQLESNL
ncbi:uncharacterized protein LTHEOB_6125 [Lasiodiplodia theobromae]|uniref:uncharacterized protein n=1 Tax=Lasiodiplodia theobromae TaxID=45133 RepID=UPI0015C3346B|nr:uncharacterized protein LTHEOB_6125 [Lasiodiplodia theobromae]KAF4544555.1 hypothetical protein LTHEOB_6125 [Lasiodiplodia theobromae]